MATTAPYGSWSSPITPELLVAGAVRLTDTWADDDHVWWSELRPEEGGRIQIVYRRPDGERIDLLPEGFSARSNVHEYGGGAWWVDNRVLFATNWSDQRLYRIDATGGGEPVPISPEPPAHHALRYADGRVTRDGRFVVCVRERHTPGDPRDVRNEIVALPTGGGRERVLAGGWDFVAAPRISRDGRQLAFLAWNHPRMPWDGTELYMGHLVVDDGISMHELRRVAGGPEESLLQPEWGKHGALYVVSDRSDWWNVYRVDDVDVLSPVAGVHAEVGGPAWTLGQSHYAVDDDGTLVYTYASGGHAYLVEVSETGDVSNVRTPYVGIRALRVSDGRLTYIADAAEHEPVVAQAKSADPAAATVLRPARDLPLTEAAISNAEPFTFASGGGEAAHAYFYPPRNPDFVGPPGERPPLVVICHGGPTGATSAAFNLGVQFWTSRGFAVVDVDYRGSTGYGRAYRRLLRGRWGIVDVEDCTHAVADLVASGKVDPNRVAIRGASAGGFTTLAALTFTEAFRAGASYFGVADLAALARDTHKFESHYLDGLVGPWPDAEATYQARSPIHHTDRLSCPIILFQGLEDRVVPPEQAEAMAKSLEAKRIPHAYLGFAGEQHGFRQAENIVRTVEAELAFYGAVFGFPVPEGTRQPEIRFGESLPST